MHLPFLPILAGVISCALAQKMSDRFTVSSTCNGKDVDAVLQEAIDMAEVASKGIDTLLNSNLLYGLRSRDNKQLVVAAKEIWGLDLDESWLTATYDSESKEMLKLVQENYQWAINAMKYGKRGVPAIVDGVPEDVSKLPSIDVSNSFFWCDSSPLKYTKIAQDIFGPNGVDKLQAEPILTMRQAFGSIANINGLWKDTEHPAAPNNGDFHWLKDGYKETDKAKGINTDDPAYPGHPLCGPDSAEAITFEDRGGTTYLDMLFCPSAWDTSNYRTSLSSLRKSTAEVFWREVRSLPGIFLHEMMHTIRSRAGGEDDKDPDRIKDQKIVGKMGEQVMAYGYFEAYILAGNMNPQPLGNGLTFTNADSYHVFATRAYCPGLDIALQSDNLSL